MSSILQQRARVLIVDDEHEHAATLARLLAREGFDSVVVHQVNDALQELRQHAFDVVLTDECLKDVEKVHQRYRDPTTRPIE